MEVDISKDILKRLEESFGEKIKSNKKIKYLLKKLENDEATYKEANEYAIEDISDEIYNNVIGE